MGTLLSKAPEGLGKVLACGPLLFQARTERDEPAEQGP